eukprot:313165-Hanusia_phi.AAC.2
MAVRSDAAYSNEIGDDTCSQPVETVRSSLKQLLQALDAMHTAGIVHGNLTWKNVKYDGGIYEIMDRNGETLISRDCDGQWSKRLTRENPFEYLQVDGSPRTCNQASLWNRPPELLVQGVADLLHCRTATPSAQAVDMWAVGCMFAELVNGAPLFESADTTFDLLSLHCDCLGYTFKSDDLEIRSSFEETDGETAAGQNGVDDLIDGSLCKHGLDLLRNLLSCDWRMRPLPSEALRHPFFSECTCTRGRRHDAVEKSVGFCEEGNRLTNENEFEKEGNSDTLVYHSFLSSGSHSDSSCSLPLGLQALVDERKRKRKFQFEDEIYPCGPEEWMKRKYFRESTPSGPDMEGKIR